MILNITGESQLQKSRKCLKVKTKWDPESLSNKTMERKLGIIENGTKHTDHNLQHSL